MTKNYGKWKRVAVMMLTGILCMTVLSGCISSCEPESFEDKIIMDGEFGYYKEVNDTGVYLVKLPSDYEVEIPEKLGGYKVKALGYKLAWGGIQLYGGFNIQTLIINYPISIYALAIINKDLETIKITCDNVMFLEGSSKEKAEEWARTSAHYGIEVIFSWQNELDAE